MDRHVAALDETDTHNITYTYNILVSKLILISHSVYILYDNVTTVRISD